VANAVAPVKAVADEETSAGKNEGVANHLNKLFQL
jgi:hydroxymethylpyrimidine pyrophosphatase-like HAD family hydrolase